MSQVWNNNKKNPCKNQGKCLQISTHFTEAVWSRRQQGGLDVLAVVQKTGAPVLKCQLHHRWAISPWRNHLTFPCLGSPLLPFPPFLTSKMRMSGPKPGWWPAWAWHSQGRWGKGGCVPRFQGRPGAGDVPGMKSVFDLHGGPDPAAQAVNA